MLLYWSLFAAPVLSGLNPYRLDKFTRRAGAVLTVLILTLVIGGREVVGCDWDTYINHYYNVSHMSFMEATRQGYPGYSVLNWIALQLKLGVYAVNIACAAIFALGLTAFARRQPKPWLTVAAAIPYLVIVVSMGFTRQATAIGLLMFAFNAFNDRRLLAFLIFVGLAGMFHSSAVTLAPLAVFIRRNTPLSPLILGGGVAALLVLMILSSAMDRYVYGYIQSEYEGEGALYRLPMNALAGMIVLMFRRRWLARYDDGRFYVIVAIGTLIILPFAFILPVMADRMSMYLLPFQIAVAARLPELVKPRLRAVTSIGVVCAYALSLYVWLTYANHATCWLPYDSIFI